MRWLNARDLTSRGRMVGRVQANMFLMEKEKALQDTVTAAHIIEQFKQQGIRKAARQLKVSGMAVRRLIKRENIPR